MNTIIVDYSGNILDSRWSIHIEDSEEFIWKEMLSSLPVNTTMEYDGVLMRKILSNSGQDQFTIFFRKSWYPLEDILRDILRFLAMDWLILFPFYFMGRFFVRETLAPVEANMNTMSHFVHDAGHELKTPLAIVSGNLQILRDAKKIEKDLIEESIATIHSMSDSLDGLLELVSLKKSEKSETIEIRKSIEETIEIRKKEVEDKNLNITIDIPKGAKIVMNPHHFSILISNLIGNAIRYNKDNGEISISYKNNLLSIKDTGIWMNEEDVKKIFDRFFRVDHSGKYEGTGIGLSVVDRIIKLYKWEISVKSSPNMGTTFIIHTK